MIKKFKAPNMLQAMKLAKEHFGESAIVLQAKKTRESVAFDSAGVEMVEITVTSDEDLAAQSTERRSSTSFYSPGGVQKVRHLGGETQTAEIKAEIGGLKEAVAGISDYLRYNKMLLLPETMRFLLDEKGFEEETASSLLQSVVFTLEGKDLRDEAKIRKALQKEIPHRIEVEDSFDLPEGRAKKICLVGPTGMGKTTSIIKMATHPQCYGKKRVAIVTIDTYRVAAAAQLKTFATLANLPLEIVYQPEEFRSALDKFRDQDVVLIDTAGRSPHNLQHMRELKSFLEIELIDETHLVLSAANRVDSSLDVVSHFSDLRLNRLILSKIDETKRLGNILSLCSKVGLPVSFLTNGQSVPDDIIIADKGDIARRILEP